MVRIVVSAPQGKMGKAISQAACADSRFSIVAGLGPEGRGYIGKDIGLVAGLGQELGASVQDDAGKALTLCDVVIDFSTRQGSLRILEAALVHKKAVVCGTTGFSVAERELFVQASRHIPVMLAANTSKVVHCMNRLLEICARELGADADIEILEMHDRGKLDAPSGTSKEMGALLAHTMGKDIAELAVYGREGHQPRTPGSIGYHSIRSGSTLSSHMVSFGFMGERLEIAHHAQDWLCFARGACEAALFLHQQPAGLYGIQDCFNASN